LFFETKKTKLNTIILNYLILFVVWILTITAAGSGNGRRKEAWVLGLEGLDSDATPEASDGFPQNLGHVLSEIVSGGKRGIGDAFTEPFLEDIVTLVNGDIGLAVSDHMVVHKLTVNIVLLTIICGGQSYLFRLGPVFGEGL